MVVGLLFGMELLVRVLMSVFERRWRMYCMVLVDGLRLFVGVGGRVMGLAVEWQ